MKSILISIIVPVYNCDKYLSELLDSILNQTYVEFEVILINDGSTDRSGEICEFYASRDSRIRVFHKENAGVSSSRNLGIKVAKGTYITFVDSDDKLKVNFLKDFDLIDKKFDLYIQGYIKWTAENKSEPIKIIQEDAAFYDLSLIIEKLEIENNVLETPWCKLFKKDIILKNNLFFNENLSNSEDHLFVLEYLQYVNSIFITSDSNYMYRLFNNQSSLSKKFIPHDKLYLYAQCIFKARMNNFTIHQLSNKYNQFAIDVHVNLVHNSLYKIFNINTILSPKEKVFLIEKYLNEIDDLANMHKYRIIKKGLLTKIIYKSNLPYKYKILQKLLS